MIHLTRLNHHELVVNSDLIEHIETTPDTVISLVNGQKFVVQESADEIVRRVVAFRHSILSEPMVGRASQSENTSHGKV